MKLDETCIAVPYSPDDVVGDWGWLWLPTSQGEEWVICRTIEDDDEDDVVVETWDCDSTADTHDCRDAYELKGTPYIPCTAPSCGPHAGAMVRVWLPGGGVVTVTHEDRDETAKALTDAVMHVLTGGEADEI